MPAIKYTDRLLIRQIASRTGLTVSSVYKILSGASGFSQSTRERVERMAQELQVRLPTLPASGVFTVGVLIPEHPTYFWSEAISGIRRTVQTLREERGIRVETVFRFVHFPISDSAVEAALEPFSGEGCNAYILYPADCPAFLRFFTAIPSGVPVVLFNDLPEDPDRLRTLRERPLTVYVGADNYDEGILAAHVLGARLSGMRNVLALLSEDSLKTVLVLLCVYGLAIGVYLSSRRNYRRGEEHGSAKWGNARAVNKKYQAANPEENKILTQNVRMGFDGKKHRRSLNTVVVGGSGAGKTRFYAKPNLCQAANAASHGTSYVVLDPKGEMLRDTGYLLAQRGYDVRVLDLLNMEKSHCYNPFVYLRDDNDVQRLVTNLFKSTTPKGSQSNDPFWDTAASMLLLALVFYLKYEAPPDEQNFSMVMEMLRAADVREDIDEYASPLDELFERLEMRDPEHIAVKYYKDYHSGSAKTLKSIQITLAARLYG